ncbi:MAG: DUF2920 family protein [Sulfurimonas sp.]|nr:DUF2920 family protein [Sulfurimonas sp.]
MIRVTKEIVSCDDFELGIKRETPLKYTITYPKDVVAKAIVFIIPGFGEDTDSGYIEHISDYVSREFSVAVVNVFYHCFYSRENNGAALEFDDFDIAGLKKVIHKYNIDFSGVKEITKESIIQKLMEVNSAINISMTLVPKNGEYQNFGVMQALAHLYVLKDIKKIEALKNVNKTICIGSSHGGYIANMIAKINPSAIDYVIDKDNNVNFPEYILNSDKVKINCFVQTYWMTDKISKYYFSPDRENIRNINHYEHIKTMAKSGNCKTKYIFYHSVKDKLAPVGDKIALTQTLRLNGFECDVKILENKEDIDGKFIKNLEHGMGMSIKELINIELPSILKKLETQEEILNNPYPVQYKCRDVTYIFDLSDPKCINNEKNCEIF